MTARPKQSPERSERYLRQVASMPCKVCGIEGFSQAAHVPADGKAIKQDDRETFALCAARPGVNGCHQDFDQYRLFTSDISRMVGRAWAADTRRQIIAMGKWPPRLPKMDEI